MISVAISQDVDIGNTSTQEAAFIISYHATLSRSVYVVYGTHNCSSYCSDYISYNKSTCYMKLTLSVSVD